MYNNNSYNSEPDATVHVHVRVHVGQPLIATNFKKYTLSSIKLQNYKLTTKQTNYYIKNAQLKKISLFFSRILHVCCRIIVVMRLCCCARLCRQ